MMESHPFLSHLVELRTRVLRTAAVFAFALAVAYWQKEAVYGWLAAPLAAYAQGGKGLIYTGLAEAFMTYLRLAYYVAVGVTAPFALMQMYLFMAPGLYKREKRLCLPILAGFPILFALGVLMAYYLVMPAAWAFFLGFETGGAGGVSLRPELKVSEYLSVAAQVMFAFGMAFQFPLLMAGAVRAGLLGTERLRRGRKLAIVGAAIVGAVLTPPDVLSQIMLAAPLVLFYELTILVCAYADRRKARKA
jgi:sec-independent protein translocase protein TatC